MREASPPALSQLHAHPSDPQHSQRHQPASHRLHITQQVPQSADSHPSPSLRAHSDRSPRIRDFLPSGPTSSFQHLATFSSIDHQVTRLFQHAVSVSHCRQQTLQLIKQRRSASRAFATPLHLSSPTKQHHAYTHTNAHQREGLRAPHHRRHIRPHTPTSHTLLSELYNL